ncbi:MAG: hypothetical protein KME04_17890 [Pleurocapsa minor GSE-CHR-MK-17-07R]|jgi:hypothetical protein|nr:hypothetical protein [Pleurocapsa minor GSE-CHR-MK 17-07R]
MAWRIQLSSKPIRRLDMLAGKPALLAAWSSPAQVHFFDLQHGTKLDHRDLAEPDDADTTSPGWEAYLRTLFSPGSMPLTWVHARACLVVTSMGGARLISGPGGVTLNAQGRTSKLDVPDKTNIISAAMDRTGDTVALLAGTGALLLYRGHIRVGEILPPIQLSDINPLHVFVPDGGGSVTVSDGQAIITYTPSGAIKAQHDIPYLFGPPAFSPDGKQLALADLESGVIRVYNPATMALLYQRFAIDLLADSRKAQLLPVDVAGGGAVGAMALNGKGAFAFSVLGNICVTNVSRFKATK